MFGWVDAFEFLLVIWFRELVLWFEFVFGRLLVRVWCFRLFVIFTVLNACALIGKLAVVLVFS